MLDSLLTASEAMPVTLPNLLMGLIAALLLGALISFTHTKSQNSGSLLDNFAVTLIMLPAVVAMIIMLIGSDIARAFSLAGAFSIIRFRSAPGNPKDITYVLLSMATGLAIGIGAPLYAFVFDILLCTVLIMIGKFKSSKNIEQNHKLVITIPEDMDYNNGFSEVLDKYTAAQTLVGVKTAALGSLYQLTYHILLKDVTASKEMIDAIRIRNGNLNISLTILPDDIETTY